MGYHGKENGNYYIGIYVAPAGLLSGLKSMNTLNPKLQSLLGVVRSQNPQY